MAKEYLLSKIIKDYNNELENILEKKDFDSSVKNLLLSMLYKIENGYDDYKKVKVNVCSKNQFVREIIETIEKRCEKIEFIKPTSDEGKKLYEKNINCIVDKENGSIKTFQNEKSMLDAILQMRQEDIKLNPKYEITKEPIKEMLLIGNNMNCLELITDFNGWSWDITINGRKNIIYNILYQYIILLTGNKVLESWINNRKDDETEELPSNLILSSKYNETFGITKKEIIGEEEDYISKIRKLFKDKYGEELEKEFYRKVIQVAILECIKNNKDYENKIQIRIKELKDQLDKMKNNKIFVENLSKEKKELNKQIEDIDIILNNEKKLKEDYEKTNENLPNKDKIFSVSHYRLLLEKQRANKLKEIKEINKKMEPNEFVKIKSEYEDKIEFYEEIKLEDKTKNNIERLITNLQETFIKCFEIKLKNTDENKEIDNLIYELRYYKFISQTIVKQTVSVKKLEEELIKKACDNKILTRFSEEDSTNYLILKEIFITKIIDLDTIVFVLKYSKGIITIKIYDGTTDDETKQIELTQKTVLTVKLNKKIKLWT